MSLHHITPITPNQLATLVQLEQQTFTETFKDVYTPEDLATFLHDKKSPEVLAEEMTSPDALFFILWQQDVAAGYLKLNLYKQPDNDGPLPAPVMEVERIYVLKQFQGLGLGKQLIEHSYRIAAENAISTIWLGVWEHNHKAIRFYQQQGFEKFGEHFFHIGNQADTDWLMKKHLS
ncbi:GNAT family N-acetyltransferase [Chitinophaga ginsengisoli]|uniref:Ribosomal protein S18 acetylase RimI-like enzyme n=1 Tax=Chitinophaga ginsengisoli TaxID=363837 RepID=A0A2P8FLF0_9BACT|nr:N-acetyltransferase [Chitinophaga ginsengisoli]PSL22554.1 ribosomal protein S18 acetylase RimI-like enzyme [Chitinophaga ginsengisoli]